ncbi:DNA polymerase beta superfamily protein [uncultured Amnibacterium sp.]|uniref:nucleotidyltransferase domain-containing protein n=1 Tax=uncultured Amnibacterium sp. TaxID=1631851 RepID=UPI0035CB9CE8
MRAVPDTLAPQVVAGIDAQLDEVERRDGVRILWAIESGSRAWGFPSPDSDYDCRFVYAHPAERYLSPWLPRDVIELPPDPVFDVNGWDLVKAVRLLVKGNATVGEWLRSPIVYRGDAAFRDAFLALAEEVFDLDRVRAHHLHVGRLQWPGDVDGGRLKPRMYALRAAASLRWLRVHSADGVPPMDLPSLIEQSDVGASLRARVAELIERKARTREAGAGSVPAEVSAFVLHEFAAAEEHLSRVGARPSPDAARRAATAFFRTWVRGPAE